jgi:hypothetical protein
MGRRRSDGSRSSSPWSDLHLPQPMAKRRVMAGETRCDLLDRAALQTGEPDRPTPKIFRVGSCGEGL